MTYQKLRQQVLERDSFICQECHEHKEFMEAHHKIPRKEGGLDILDNLITICRKCHFNTHGKHLHYKRTRQLRVNNGILIELNSIKHKGETYSEIIKRVLEVYRKVSSRK